MSDSDKLRDFELKETILDKAKGMFADKWVQHVVLGILTVFGLAIGAALIKAIGLS